MEVFKENYDTTVNRGLITPYTTDLEFANKLKEEVFEWEMELIHPIPSKRRKLLEAGDIITVMASWIIHKGFDPEKILKEVLEKNNAKIK